MKQEGGRIFFSFFVLLLLLHGEHLMNYVPVLMMMRMNSTSAMKRATGVKTPHQEREKKEKKNFFLLCKVACCQNKLRPLGQSNCWVVCELHM